MKLRISLALLLGLFATGAALAQQTPGPQLDPQQTEGRNTLARSCSICHLPPQYNAPTYGPRLHQGTLGGNESVLREVISNGTPRMPGFKHMYNTAQINAVIAYLKTVPAPAPTVTPASQNR